MLKKLLVRFLILCLFIIFAGVGIQYFGTKKLHSYLKSISKKEKFDFKELSTDFLSGDVNIIDLSFQKDSLMINADNFQVKGISYYEYFFNKTINIKEIRLENSKITGKLIQQEEENENDSSKVKKPFKNPKIDVKKLSIVNTTVDMIYKDTFQLKGKQFDLVFNDIKIDSVFKNQKHFHFKKVRGNITDFYAQVSQIQGLSFKKLALEKTSLSIDSLKLIPLEAKHNYIYKIPKRKELFNLSVAKIDVPFYQLNTADSTSIISPKVIIEEVDLNIYADRVRFTHPNKRKHLYSKALRNLPFHLKLDTVLVSDSKVQYEELSKRGRKPGIIYFDDLNATITNLTNIKLENTYPTTQIDIQSEFMKTSPLKIDWNFNVGHFDDTFYISGSLLNVPPRSINSFLTPALNIRVTSGKIKQLYFNFKGNDYVSNGDFAIDFDNVKFRILKQGRVRKFQSFLANMLVKKSSRNKLRTARIKDVTRDQTRSFWGFFWKNIKTGLSKTMR